MRTIGPEDFALHPRLAADTLPVGDLPLCRVLLMGDARFPWLILVPRRPGLREFGDLPAEERAALMEEICTASRALQDETGAEKMNVGALGNAVAQLHIHVVARSSGDAAWPGPVWGSGAAEPYRSGLDEALADRLAAAFGFRRGGPAGRTPETAAFARSRMTPSDFAKSAATLGFAHNALDRLANRRDDDAFQAETAASPAARTVAVIGDTVAVKRDAAGAMDLWFGFDAAAEIGPLGQRVFLGLDARGPAYAVQVEAEGEDPLAGRDGLAAFNLRQVAADGSVAATDLGALAEGKSMLSWHATHRFCGRCGSETASSPSGWKRLCPACGAHHFPRTDPVVIMLAVDGDRCLLGRQPRFPAGMYSCLAGFLEPGETIEDAVRREIGEEAGIACGAVSYLGCQPWPFPSSLMIGCVAEAASTEIAIDREELEDARWFSRDEVRAMLDGRHPDGLTCPMPMAIAHHIVLAWVGEG